MATKDIDFEEIKTIAILVEIDGNCHQVLSTSNNKFLALRLLAQMDGNLKLSERIEPVIFQSVINHD